MGDTWITDIRHFANIPEAAVQARKLRDYVGRIVEFITVQDVGFWHETDIQCRRKPKRRKCDGTLVAYQSSVPSEIHWRCPICEDNGVIRGFEGTMWDKSRKK